MASYILPSNGPTTVILADNRNWNTSWYNHTVVRKGLGGVDLVAAVGTPVYAPADGTVSLHRWNGTAGHTITLSQAGGWRDQFMHMREPNPMAVANGATVRQGQLIGWTGNTANNRVGGVAQHLHWHRIDPQGRRQNPKNYFGSGTSTSGGGSVTPIGVAFGLSGDAQKAIQGALQKLGLYGGAVDGVFGAQSVKGVQQLLKNAGQLPGNYNVDGVPGPTYGKALQTFAKSYGYSGPIDGAPGDATSRALITWANTVLSPAPTPTPAPTPSAPAEGYAWGLSGDAQRAAQEALTKLGLYAGKIDGEFGSLSVKGMQQYLKNVNLLPGDYNVDGVPGAGYGKAIQTLVQKHGYTGPVDGVPGNATSVALVAWAASIGAPVTPAPAPTPTPEVPVPQTPTVGSFGIDIATSQKDINLATAKAQGVQFVIVKASGYNVSPQYVAPNYRRQIVAVSDQGLYKGHYYLPGSPSSPAQQADYFVDNLYNFDVNKDVLALDNEPLDANKTYWKQDQVMEFIDRVRERTGIPYSRIWLYCPASLTRESGPWDKVTTTEVKIWWAAYGNKPSGKVPDHEPSLQGKVARWDIHQFTSSSEVAGYKLDGNYSKHKVEDLFAKGNVVIPEQPAPEPVPEVDPEPGTDTPAPTPAPATGTPKWVVATLTAALGLITSVIAYFAGISQ